MPLFAARHSFLMVFSAMRRALAGAAGMVTMTTAVNVTAHARIVETITTPLQFL